MLTPYEVKLGVDFNQLQLVADDGAKNKHNLHFGIRQHANLHGIAIGDFSFSNGLNGESYLLHFDYAVSNLFCFGEEGVAFCIDCQDHKGVWLIVPGTVHTCVCDDEKQQHLHATESFNQMANYVCAKNQSSFSLQITVHQAVGMSVIPFVLASKCTLDEKGVIALFCQRPSLVKSDWFDVSRAIRFFDYWFAGAVYDPRATSNGTRFTCQQCAYSWWKYFNWLASEQCGSLFISLRNIVAESVLHDTDGGRRWNHGERHSEGEVHTRFLVDGGNLFLAQFALTREAKWLQAARQTAEYVFEHLLVDLGENGIWVLHDSLEQHSAFQFKDRLFGKHYKTSYVINTHMQALSFFYDLGSVSGNNQAYREQIARGLHALNLILSLPGCSYLNQSICRLLKRSKIKSAKGIFSLISKKIQMWLWAKVYWLSKRLYPQFVMQDGYIDRDLNQSCMPLLYHIINLKDMLILYSQIPEDFLMPIIDRGVKWTLLQSEPGFAEWQDVVEMYHALTGRLTQKDIDTAARHVQHFYGGHSIDAIADPTVTSVTRNSKWAIYEE